MWSLQLFTWRIWARKHDNRYEEVETVEHPMPRFKHEVYAFALKKRHKVKCLYLYQGWRRVAKATFDPHLKITFRSPAWARSFDEAPEQISALPCFFHWLESDFEKTFESKTTQHHLMEYTYRAGGPE